MGDAAAAATAAAAAAVPAAAPAPVAAITTFADLYAQLDQDPYEGEYATVLPAPRLFNG